MGRHFMVFREGSWEGRFICGEEVAAASVNGFTVELQDDFMNWFSFLLSHLFSLFFPFFLFFIFCPYTSLFRGFYRCLWCISKVTVLLLLLLLSVYSRHVSVPVCEYFSCICVNTHTLRPHTHPQAHYTTLHTLSHKHTHPYHHISIRTIPDSRYLFQHAIFF